GPTWLDDNEPARPDTAMRALRHGPRHKTANNRFAVQILGPDHCPAHFVSLDDDAIVWNGNPLAIEADAVMPILGVPIDIRDRHAVRSGAARTPLLAAQTFEP